MRRTFLQGCSVLLALICAFGVLSAGQPVSSLQDGEAADEASSKVDPAIAEARSHLRNNLPMAASIAKKRLADPAPLSVPERADLLWVAGSALSIMGEHQEALTLLEEGVTITDAKPLAKIRRRLLRYVAASAFETGTAERGAAAAREALEISVELGDTSSYVALLHNELANNENRLGHVEEAIRHYRLGLEIAEREANPRQKAMILSNLAGVYGQLNQHSEAVGLLNEVLRIALEADLKPVLASTFVSLGDNHLSMGNVEYASRNYQEALARCDAPGMRTFLAAAELGLGDVAIHQNRIVDDQKHYEKAIEVYKDVDDPSGLLTAENRMITLRQTEQQAQKTIELLEESLRKAEELQDSYLIQETCRRLAMLYEQTEDYENTVRVLRRAMDLQVETWNLAHAEELAKTQRLLDFEKIQRLQNDSQVKQAHLERQRQRNAFLLGGLLLSILLLLVFSRMLSDRRKAIQQLKTAEAEIRQQKQVQIAMERRLAEQQRTESLGVMAAGIAHDFNNLLTAISGFAEVGTLYDDHEKKNELFRQITSVAFQAADLTRQLRQFMARPDEVRATSNLRDVVESMLPLMNSISRPNAHVEIHSDLTGLFVGIDDAQLRQILLNLVSNSVDAAPEEGGKILVQLSNRELTREDLDAMRGSDFAEPGRFCCIEVSDNGPGITEEIQKRIFDPYFSTKSVGRGLGLASVLGIVRSCRGAVQVISIEGHGTTFRVCIPQVDGTLAAPSYSGAAYSAAYTSSQLDERKLILLVDDEPLIRKSICDVLMNVGYDVQTASDAYSAMKLLPSIIDRLSIAIVDYSMPGETGVWLAQRLNEQRPGLPVIICSGYAAESIPTDVNIRKFMQKPYLPSELLREVRKCVDHAANSGSNPT